MSENSANGLPRFVMEAAVAAVTGAFGAAVIYGSIEAGAGWTDMGPDAGYFPFYLGVLIIFGSVVNFFLAFTKHRGGGEIFIDWARFKVVLGFLLPVAAFTVVSTFLGLYVGTALYIAGMVVFQGRYRWWAGLAAGIGVALFFFVVFEIGFKVPLLKGPLEAFLGIY
jgi:hypothetical protein